MKHQKIFSLCIAFIMLVTLSGCSRWIDWAERTFYQGEARCPSRAVPKRYLRSVVAYDQFTTIAMFDALWLSDEVKTAFTDTYMLKFGKSQERKLAFLRRQLEESKHYISFYVLSSYRMVLGDPQSEWSLFLSIDDQFFTPVEIKEVDLDPVYIAFFGRKINQFKLVYRVKFDARDANDNLLLSPDVQHCMALVFRSFKKEVTLSWLVLPSGVVEQCPDPEGCYQTAPCEKKDEDCDCY